jgi:hypothetical protein
MYYKEVTPSLRKKQEGFHPNFSLKDGEQVENQSAKYYIMELIILLTELKKGLE